METNERTNEQMTREETRGIGAIEGVDNALNGKNGFPGLDRNTESICLRSAFAFVVTLTIIHL